MKQLILTIILVLMTSCAYGQAGGSWTGGSEAGGTATASDSSKWQFNTSSTDQLLIHDVDNDVDVVTIEQGATADSIIVDSTDTTISVLDVTGKGTIGTTLDVAGKAAVDGATLATDKSLMVVNTGTGSTEYGVYGGATGAATTSYGGFFTASGASTNYGIYSAAGDNVLVGDTTISSYLFDFSACTNDGYALVSDGANGIACEAVASAGSGDIDAVWNTASGDVATPTIEAGEYLKITDDVEGIQVGSNSDWTIKYDETTTDALIFSSANAAANTDVSFINTDGTYKADITTDGAVTADSFATSALTGKRFIRVSNDETPDYASPATGDRHFRSDTTPACWEEYNGSVWIPDCVFGEIYDTGAPAFTEATTSTFAAVNDASIGDGILYGVTHGATKGQLTLTYAGTYEFSYALDIKNSAEGSSDNIEASLGISGISASTNCNASHMNFTPDDNRRTINKTCILAITAGQYVQILARNIDDATSILDIYNMNIVAKRLSR